MASTWYARVTLIDDHEKKTSMRFFLGEIDEIDFGVEASQAQITFEALLADLNALTLANVYKASLSAEIATWSDPTVPATGSDISEELVLNCHTNDSLKPTEVDQLRVPSVVDTVWINDNYEEGLDLADALVAAYVANFETNVYFSDGENVNLAEGTNGVQSGFWRSRAKRID